MASKDKQIVVSIDNLTIIKGIALVIVAVLGFSFFKSIVQPLVLILMASFLALALNPAVSLISRLLRSKSRVRATAIAYAFVLAFLISFFSLVIPPLFKQTADFLKEVPGTIQDVKKDGSALNQFIDRYQLEDEVDKFASDFGARFGDIGKPALSTASKVGSTLFSTIIVLVLTFMMLVEGPMWIKKFWAGQPKRMREHRKDLAARMYKVVTNYVNGQVVIAGLGGGFAMIVIFIMSKIFDASVNPIALGAIVMLFALLPLIGSTIAAVIVCLACLLVSVPLAIAMAIYFVIYQQIENITIQPYIQSKGNSLTPLLVFISAIVGASFGGIMGVFLAIPTAGCLMILLEDYFDHRKAKAPKAT